MEIIKLSPWNDPVTYALPGFILSILAEAYILFVKRKQKINKKKAKISSRFTKKQVQALRVFEKISTHSGSIFSKKLAFLKPST